MKPKSTAGQRHYSLWHVRIITTRIFSFVCFVFFPFPKTFFKKNKQQQQQKSAGYKCHADTHGVREYYTGVMWYIIFIIIILLPLLWL